MVNLQKSITVNSVKNSKNYNGNVSEIHMAFRHMISGTPFPHGKVDRMGLWGIQIQNRIDLGRFGSG